jgi:hypothetical protein
MGWLTDRTDALALRPACQNRVAVRLAVNRSNDTAAA